MATYEQLQKQYNDLSDYFFDLSGGHTNLIVTVKILEEQKFDCSYAISILKGKIFDVGCEMETLRGKISKLAKKLEKQS